MPFADAKRKKMKIESRIKRHKRIRKHIVGTRERPRLAVFRSGKHTFAQIINDENDTTLAACSDIKMKGTKNEKAYEVGKLLAQKALKAKITSVVFDRGGFLYHGRVEMVAKGTREGGLKF